MIAAPDSPAKVALLLDFDGTLVPIAPTPDSVHVDPALPDLLARLRDATGGALAIVTGRRIADIDGFLPGLAPDVCGLHGLDRRVGGRRLTPPLRDLTDEIAELAATLADDPRLLVEDKRVGVAVHWRLAPDGEARARAAIDALLARLGPDYRIQDGKAVREIVPASSGKGAAVAFLLAMPPYVGRRPVFIGDDRTDEPALAAAEAAGGIGVKIGPGETAASRRLPSPEALLGALGAWLAGGPGPEAWSSG